jgi:hypothetical protein
LVSSSLRTVRDRLLLAHRDDAAVVADDHPAVLDHRHLRQNSKIGTLLRGVRQFTSFICAPVLNNSPAAQTATSWRAFRTRTRKLRDAIVA